MIDIGYNQVSATKQPCDANAAPGTRLVHWQKDNVDNGPEHPYMNDAEELFSNSTSMSTCPCFAVPTSTTLLQSPCKSLQFLPLQTPQKKPNSVQVAWLLQQQTTGANLLRAVQHCTEQGTQQH